MNQKRIRTYQQTITEQLSGSVVLLCCKLCLKLSQLRNDDFIHSINHILSTDSVNQTSSANGFKRIMTSTKHVTNFPATNGSLVLKTLLEITTLALKAIKYDPFTEH